MVSSTGDDFYEDNVLKKSEEFSDTSSESSEKNESKEPGRLTALILRREKARLEQQKINAQSFLKKSNPKSDESLVPEYNSTVKEKDQARLDTYAQEAGLFLDKALNEDSDGDVLVLGGKTSSEGNSSRDKYSNDGSLDSDEIVFERSTGSSTISDDKRKLERYAHQFGEFLTIEPEENEILMNSGMLSSSEISSNLLVESEKLDDLDRSLSFSNDPSSIQNFSRIQEMLSESSPNESFSEPQREGSKYHEQSFIENLEVENQVLTDMLVNSYATMDMMVSEVEETIDAMARDNARLKSISEIYRSQAEEIRHKFETVRNCDQCNVSDSLELQLQQAKIEIDESKLKYSALEQKLNSRKEKFSSKERRYVSEIEALKRDLSNISKENERERTVSRELRQKLMESGIVSQP